MVTSENEACEGILHCQGKWHKFWTDITTETYMSGFLELIIAAADASGPAYVAQTDFHRQTLELAEFYQNVLNDKIATNFDIRAGNGAMIPCHRNVLEGTVTFQFKYSSH